MKPLCLFSFSHEMLLSVSFGNNLGPGSPDDNPPPGLSGFRWKFVGFIIPFCKNSVKDRLVKIRFSFLLQITIFSVNLFNLFGCSAVEMLNLTENTCRF